MYHKRLANSDHTLLGTRDGTLEQDKVVLDDTVMWEATQRRDVLFGNIRFCRRIRLVLTRADAVDLLVELRTMMIPVWAPRQPCHLQENNDRFAYSGQHVRLST